MEHTYEITGKAAQSYDLDFARSHYNIYPWIAERDALVRVIRFPRAGTPYVARISRVRRGLRVHVFGDPPLCAEHAKGIRKIIAFCLGLDTDYRLLDAAAVNDRVLAAALRTNRGIRPKRYGDLFEAVCGAICAQNVDFRRLYQMMELLAKHFGPRVEIGDTRYWAFPSAEEVRKASLAELRECKVGYRANRILKASEWFSAISQPSRLSVSELQELDGESALQRVCEIPGIGPYSAAIVLSAGAGRQDIFHLDSFTRYILHQFYFDGREVTDTELRDFVETKWSGIGGSVAHVLTTNTETWAKNLGHEVSRRSAARQ